MSIISLSPKEAKVAIVSVLTYVTVYSLEAPIRYILTLLHLDTLILFRDLLISGPIFYIAVRQIMQRKVNSILLTFVIIIFVQGMFFYLNFHSFTPVFFGIKLFVNMALGLLTGALLVNCSGRVLKVVIFLFCASVIGVFLEKFVVSFPWVGMSTTIGGIEVPISMDWGGDDPMGHRAGGFARLSINLAGLLPFLACIIAPKCRSLLLRLIIMVFAASGSFLTTQKGAVVAALMVSVGLILPNIKLRLFALRCLAIAGGIAQIALPFVTADMLISEGDGGVFTASSFAARVIYTWPSSLKYLSENSIGVFGTGFGSLGSPMRVLMGGADWLFPDNMFLFLYGYLGIFALVFYGAVVAVVWRSMRLPNEYCEAAMAITAFVLWYGTVISGFEDQVLSLAIGASLGTIINARPNSVMLPAFPRISRRFVS